jgi:prepilin-type N-terminal cleavage/methylation domain-containing protein
MHRNSLSRGFTLIELLVVIAIIAILSATLMPVLNSSLDRSRVMECRTNLTELMMALRMYYADQGGYPPTLAPVTAGKFLTDDATLRCTKTGQPFYYAPPAPGGDLDAVVAACCDPKTPDGQRPHGFRHSFLELQRGGKLVEVGR